MQNYEFLLSRITSHTNIEKEEIEKRIEARRAKLSGLISKEGAAQIIAAELGVNFDNVQLKIIELMPGMRKANALVKIIRIFPVREFNKGGKSGKVANLIVADDSGSIKAVLWDTNHISLIETNQIKEGDTIEIKNASMRDSEIHLSGFSDIKKSDLLITNVKMEQAKIAKTLVNINAGDNISTRGIIVQVFGPKFFNVCPECNKRVAQVPEGYSCQTHGVVLPSEKAILNFVLDDGTESIRVVLFSDQITKIASNESLKLPDKFLLLKEDLLGSEFYISGNVRKNQFFNNLELIGEDIEKVSVEGLIKSLEISLK
jgi:ssDNA-binding replication factor A large subunit